MSAIADVAHLAGVSKSTASRALSGGGYVSEATRTKVLEAASRLGYVASPNAASLVTGKTKNVGVLMPLISRWFFGEVLEGIEHRLLSHGFDMTLYNVHPGDHDRDEVFDFFLARKRFDGVIAVGIEPNDRDTERLLGLGKPLASLGGAIPGIRSIAIDDVAVARLATNHLISLGHTDIMHFGGPRAEHLESSVHGKRLIGFTEAMDAAGLPSVGRFRPTTMSVPGGYDVAVNVLADPLTRPTAVFAACDEIAIGTIIAARRLGISVPSELSVIGIDGHEYADMFSLTTIEQSPRDQGVAVVDLLMREITETHPSDVTVDVERMPLPTRLVVRSSTARVAESVRVTR